MLAVTKKRRELEKILKQYGIQFPTGVIKAYANVENDPWDDMVKEILSLFMKVK